MLAVLAQMQKTAHHHFTPISVSYRNAGSFELPPARMRDAIISESTGPREPVAPLESEVLLTGVYMVAIHSQLSMCSLLGTQ